MLKYKIIIYFFKYIIMKNLVNFLFEMWTLRRIKRSYYINIYQDTESVAEHSHRVSIIGYMLAKKLNADSSKVLLMCTFHDMTETRTWDSNWVQKPYVKQDEHKVLNDQLIWIPELSDELKIVIEEYNNRNTLESKIAKDADVLEYFLSLKELALTWNEEAKRRLDNNNTRLEYLYTDEAKTLWKLIKYSNPTDWCYTNMDDTWSKYIAKS